MRRPRLVLDTNVLVSAFVWRGLPGRLIELAGEKEIQLLTSRADDSVLACALAARADLIVSGDDDLLVLGSFNNIPIDSVASAVRQFAGKG